MGDSLNLTVVSNRSKMSSPTLSILKFVKLRNNEPKLLQNHMESYFKQRPPDCTLYSKGNSEIHVHKEILYQTSYLREMIRTLETESKIEIICPSLTLRELEVVIQFLYYGQISVPNESLACETSKNLVELFGFPLIAVESIWKPKLVQEQDSVPEDSKCVIVHVDSKYEISSQAPMIKVFTLSPDPLEPIPKKRSRKQNLKLHHSYYEPEFKQETFHTEEIIDD